jgi:CRP-like cAMP-binding protein
MIQELHDKISKATYPYLFQNSFILNDLPQQDIDILHSHAKPEERKRGEILFRQGSFPTGAYWLVKGKVKIFQGIEDNQRQTMYIYSDNDLIAYRQLIANQPNPVSATLLENSTLRFIPGEVFRQLIKTSPFFTRNVLSALAHEFTVWMNRMSVFQKFPVRTRLALTLLVLHEQYRLSGTAPGTITITRTELAEFVGASLETIVRTMNTFKSSNLVQIKGRQIILTDLDGLLELLQNS